MKRSTLLLLVCLIWNSISAQNKPTFWNEIQQFKSVDEAKTPETDAVLLIGSSSFTMWKDIHDYFPGTKFINRGFGGSSIKDLNYYSTELLKPYQPKQIIIYCGENDFAAEENLEPIDVFNRYKDFYEKIRKYHPNTPVAYISIKVSPSRNHLWPKFIETNSLIQNFMAKSENAEYIDITKAMAGKDSQLYLEDLLHMTPAGYTIWTAQIMPYIK